MYEFIGYKLKGFNRQLNVYVGKEKDLWFQDHSGTTRYPYVILYEVHKDDLQKAEKFIGDWNEIKSRPKFGRIYYYKGLQKVQFVKDIKSYLKKLDKYNKKLIDKLIGMEVASRI